MNFDYSGKSGNAYHTDRHRDLIDNPILYDVWSRYAQQVYYPNLHSPSRILEVGAGLGANLASLSADRKCYAVEPSPIGRKYCERFCHSVYRTIDDIPRSLQFNVILLRHVLEHVDTPLSMLKTLSSHLAQNGTMIVVLPIENPLKAILIDDPDHHLYCWNRQTASNLLNSAGYTVEHDRINWINGRKLFLPLDKMLGVRTYRLATSLLGRIRFKSEFILWATHTYQNPAAQ